MTKHVTMTEAHYNKLKEEATEARKAGRYGEFALLTTKKNVPALAMMGAIGVVWSVLQSEWITTLTVVREHWWVKGGLVMIIGWYLWRRQNPYAQVVLALGVVELINSFKARPKSAKPKESEKPKETSDPDEAAWDTGADTGWQGRYRWGGEVAGGNEPVLTSSARTVEMADRIFRGAVAA